MKSPTQVVKEVPCSKESEMMVLGSMINCPQDLIIGAESLTKEDFFFSNHKEIFQTLKEFYWEDKPADLGLICEHLKSQEKLENVGGTGYITQLAQYAGTSAHVKEYSKILRDKSLSRKFIKLAQEAQNEFLDDPKHPELVAGKFHQKFVDLEKRYSPNDKASIGEILSGSKSRAEPIPLIEKLKFRQDYHKKHNKPCLTGLPTGFIDLDNKVTVLENTNLVVLAARPAMGKTAFALNILSNICFDQGLAVGFISLEMGADQLVERLLSSKTGIPGEKLKRGTFSDVEYRKLQEEDDRLRRAKFFIHDQAANSVSQVVSHARRLKDEEDIRILAIDYIQLLGTDRGSDSRQYEVAEVSRSLKRLAMELKIPILVIAQLSRKVEERSDKRPLMSDLRDSGQIEQDADAILFVYREEYYNPQLKKGQAKIILVKNRHGPTTDVSLNFKSDCGAFDNLAVFEKMTAYHNYD
ncbi:MAG: replicative DNA helicase [Waddliaceae bacterium]